MKIHKEFIGGNITVVRIDGKDVYLENELRDTTVDWFYWAFCVEGAEGKTLTFHFQNNRLGYWGPAISHDLMEWRWLNQVGDNEFTYTFQKDEKKVYFAHNMLYLPDRFVNFCKTNDLKIEELCKSRKERSIPCVKIGNGARSIILTARHHACEATGNYVLEGVLKELIQNPIQGTTIFCVPFVDYDGVVDGDQGKSRYPHDHNRDYDLETPPIYPATAKIQEYAKKNGCCYGFDFHSPWHKGGVNDKAFIVQNSFQKLDRLNAFGEILEKCMNEKAFQYSHVNDYPFKTNWNQGGTQFANYMKKREENELAFTLETAYFGENGNVVTQENLPELGKCFALAIKTYTEEKEGKIPLKN